VYIDIEDTEYYNEHNIDPYSSEGRELITRIAVTVMDRVSRAGYTAGVYANWNYFQNVLIQSEIQAYKWLAWYKEDTSEVRINIMFVIIFRIFDINIHTQYRIKSL